MPSGVPELPDVTIYLEALERRILGRTLENIRIASPFVVRTYDPPIGSVKAQPVERLARVGKRIALGFPDDVWLVIHLMIAGRLHWKEPGAKLARGYGLAAFDFADGTLTFTEASPKKRASIHMVRGEAGLRALDAGGIDVMASDLPAFRAALTAENHTLKRALTDPRLLSGIGNAYSDEILHRAQLSPIAMTAKLTDQEFARLHDATKTVLAEWIDRFRAQTGEKFPEKVTAFRPEMAVHGKYRQPCPVCGTPVQRIVHADNETNYCPRCQTGGRLLADRSLSRLLKSDWPKTIDELEQTRAGR
jgi:formamidopyrimidine-DNA glycosylase